MSTQKKENIVKQTTAKGLEPSSQHAPRRGAVVKRAVVDARAEARRIVAEAARGADEMRERAARESREMREAAYEEGREAAKHEAGLTQLQLIINNDWRSRHPVESRDLEDTHRDYPTRGPAFRRDDAMG